MARLSIEIVYVMIDYRVYGKNVWIRLVAESDFTYSHAMSVCFQTTREFRQTMGVFVVFKEIYS